MISVVIPTYNRGRQLRETVESIFRSDLSGLGTVEILVVDDGSATPAQDAIGLLAPPPGIGLRVIRKPNGGPGSARNWGFRASRGELVLFVDDDILVSPRLIQGHVDAHRKHPKTVVMGHYPYMPVKARDPLVRYLDDIGRHPKADGRDHGPFRARFVASAMLSVERRLFDGEDGVYAEGLSTPGAEEFELSYRLAARGVPILQFPELSAVHNHPISIAGACAQQYKYGIACGELAVKRPDLLAQPEFGSILRHNGPIQVGDGFRLSIRKATRSILAGRPARKALIGFAGLLEALHAPEAILRRSYRTVMGLHFLKGIRDGLERYGRPASSRPGPGGSAPA